MKPTLTGNKRFHQGIYKPQNPDKFVGDVNNIIYRSGLELRCLRFFDRHPDVLKVASEEIIIPYMSKIDGRPHRYYMDFIIQLRNKKDEVKTYLIEVKPDSQTREPKPPKSGKHTKRYLRELQTYVVNECKWEAAQRFAEKKGWQFMILTEKTIDGKKH